jgi:hypothetical protein
MMPQKAAEIERSAPLPNPLPAWRGEGIEIRRGLDFEALGLTHMGRAATERSADSLVRAFLPNHEILRTRLSALLKNPREPARFRPIAV